MTTPLVDPERVELLLRLLAECEDDIMTLRGVLLLEPTGPLHDEALAALADCEESATLMRSELDLAGDLPEQP